MIKCVVLDYSTGNVNMHEFSDEQIAIETTPGMEISDAIESILSNQYNLNSIDYMFGNNININF